MKRKTILLLNSVLLSVIFLAAGCGEEGNKEPAPYEYTSSDEIKQIDYYEGGRIRDAERTLLLNLEQLGQADLMITGGEEASSPEIEYTLPEGATQGPDTWYIFYFHFLIEFEGETGGGFCDVRASPGATVEFETLRVNDSPFIRISPYANSGSGSSTSTRIEVRYYVYMTLHSVKPGKSTMSFSYEEYQGARIKSVKVFNDTGIETTSTAPSEAEAGSKLTEEETSMAKEIAFGDARVQEIASGKEYALRITRSEDMIRLADEPPDDDIEVRLVFAQTYTIDGVEATALDVFVDLEEAVVTDLFPLGDSGMPGLTDSEKERVVAIALADARVQEMLAGRPYAIGYLGISMGGPVGRRGANVQFVFDTPYPLEPDAPMMPERLLTGVTAFVNLSEGKVVQIYDESSLAD